MSASNTAESQDPKSDVDARYGLDAEEVQFVSQLTGIKDAKHVKEHLITIEEEAYTVRRRAEHIDCTALLTP